MACLHFSMLALHFKKRNSILTSSGKQRKWFHCLLIEKTDRQIDQFFKIKLLTSSLKQYTTTVCSSVHRWSILIIIQRDATQSNLFIILQVHCICFGCEPHPSLAVHKTVTTDSGTVQLPPSNVAKLAWPRWREVAGKKIKPVPEAVVRVLCTADDYY